MLRGVGAELWVGGRDGFVFRCTDRVGTRWTFYVGRTSLERLDHEPSVDDPAWIFQRHRADIYAAACRRMAFGDETQQQVISVEDILGCRNTKQSSALP